MKNRPGVDSFICLWNNLGLFQRVERLGVVGHTGSSRSPTSSLIASFPTPTNLSFPSLPPSTPPTDLSSASFSSLPRLPHRLVPQPLSPTLLLTLSPTFQTIPRKSHPFFGESTWRRFLSASGTTWCCSSLSSDLASFSTGSFQLFYG